MTSVANIFAITSERVRRVLDRVEHDLSALCAVDRVRIDPRPVQVVGLERLGELLSRAGELVDGHAATDMNMPLEAGPGR